MDQYGNAQKNPTLFDVFIAAKANCLSATHCAEVCRITQTLTNTYLCKVLGQNTLIDCACLSGLTVNDGDIVLVIFTDHQFRENLTRITNGLDEVQSTKNETLHSLNNGVIVGILYS